MPAPSVGRIVHFWSGGKCRPAVILDIYAAVSPMPEQCVLRVFLPAGPDDVSLCGEDAEVICEHGEDKTESSWHWPERVE